MVLVSGPTQAGNQEEPGQPCSLAVSCPGHQQTPQFLPTLLRCPAAVCCLAHGLRVACEMFQMKRLV
jgi:hypothetical protein